MSHSARKTQYLVLSMIGKDHIGTTNILTKLCITVNANILDSRMTKMGAEYSISALLAGKWSSIAKIEAALPNLKKEHDFEYIATRTEMPTPAQSTVQYTVQITTIDKPGIVHALAKFFKDNEIHIDDINTEAYRASRTNTDMFRMTMVVNIPDSIQIMNLREQFMTYCEHENLDAILIEPQKY